MKRRRHTPEQIIRKLREADRLLAQGQQVPEVAKQLEISEATYHRWRAQYGGLKADDARRLKELQAENTRLKRLLAEAELEKDALRELAKGNLCARHAAAAPWSSCSACWASRSGWPAGSSANTAPPNATSPPSLTATGRWVSSSASSAEPIPAGGIGAHAHLRSGGWVVNRKTVQRLWRQEGLRVPIQRRKRKSSSFQGYGGDRFVPHPGQPAPERPTPVLVGGLFWHLWSDRRMP
jgi:putative transposase